MKIVVNTRSLLADKLDGIGWFTYQTLKRIAQSHPEHEFVFLFDRPFDSQFIFNDNVKPIVLFPPARHPFLYVLYYEFSVRNILKKLKPDVFLGPDGLLSLGSKTKQIAVIHDINFYHYPQDLGFFYRHYYNFFMPKFAKKASKIATVSQFSKQDLVQTYKILPEKISVVYNGVNEGYKVLNEEEKQATKIAFSGGKDYFLFVGSMSPRKNLVRLIEAFALFKKQSLSDFKLVLAGGNFWGESDLHAVIEKHQLSEEILFTGRVSQDDLEKIMGSAYALTFVSYFEGFGIPLVEAMQCEVPIICSKESCMPEIAGKAAYYVDSFDIESIAAGLSALWENAALRETLIESGKIQKQKFSWDITAQKLWDVIMETVKKA
jgi:glycosyltransferase involved in cell wall biosynthesis